MSTKSSSKIPCTIKSNYLMEENFLMLPFGSGLVIAFPYLLFSSIFKIFVTTFLSSKKSLNLIFYFIDKFEVFFWLILRYSCVGRTINAFDKCWWKQPLSELAEVYFWGLYGNFFVISFALLSNVSQSVTVSWTLLILFRSRRFFRSRIYQNLFTFLYSLSLIIPFLCKL